MASYEQLLDTFKASLNDHEGYKKETILALAHSLEKEKQIPKEKISEKLADDLRGYCSARYIRECLGSEFKNQSQVREDSSRKSSAESEEEMKKELVEVSNSGSQSFDEQVDDMTDRVMQKVRGEIPESADKVESSDIVGKVLDERVANPDYRLMFLEAQKMLEEKNTSIDQLTAEKDRVNEALEKVRAKTPSALVENKPPEDLDAFTQAQQKLLKQLEYHKESFDTHADLDLNDVHIPISVYVNPALRVVKLAVDRNEARKRGLNLR